MTPLTKIPWHFQGGQMDAYFDVMAPVNWEYPIRGRIIRPLCGQYDVVTSRGLSNRRGKFQLFVPGDQARDHLLQTLITAANDMTVPHFSWGPTDGTTPEANVRFDPTVAINEEWRAEHRIITIGLIEVGQTALNVPPPPPLLPPVDTFIIPPTSDNAPAPPGSGGFL